jgi:hypothetical protein
VSNKFHIIYIAVIAALLVLLGVSLSRPDKVVEVTKHLTDSITIVKHDTLTITKVVEVEKRVVDTMYVKSEPDSTPIPISEYRFFKPNEYDITARGFNVTMPSITVFPKTITTTVTNTIEKELIVHKWDIYGGFGIWRFKDEWIPNIGLSVKAPKNLLFTVNLGHYEKNLLYGGTVYYNFGKK